jgi:lysosomal alpha-mannosidase
LFGDIDSQPLNSFNTQNRTKYVHIIPHSHTDLGWQGTIQDYFQGQNLEFYIGSVNSILTTVVQELSRDSNRTFSYAEVEFFKMWWDRQNDIQRA